VTTSYFRDIKLKEREREREREKERKRDCDDSPITIYLFYNLITGYWKYVIKIAE